MATEKCTFMLWHFKLSDSTGS